MSDKEGSPWEKLLSELLKQTSQLWDWVAALAGGAGGAGVTIAVHVTDLGTSIAAGALGAVAARKAVHLSLQGRRLKRRALGLKKSLEELEETLEGRKLLLGRLDSERKLWEEKVISDEEFSKQLDQLTDGYRQAVEYVNYPSIPEQLSGLIGDQPKP